MTAKTNTIEINLTAQARFRAELFPIGTKPELRREDKFGEWRETYEEAEADLVTKLVNQGEGYAGEIDKVYATSNSWDVVDAEKAAAEAKV